MSFRQSLLASLLVAATMAIGSSRADAQTVLETRYHDNGRVSTLWFDMGGERIQVLRFYANGQLQEIGNWESGRMHGVWANWAENGNKLGEAEYRYGRRSGKWRLWDASGKPSYELEYRSDALVAYSQAGS